MSASRFYAALTALLFLAVSAWTGAALFGRLPAWAGAALFGRIPAPQAEEESPPPQAGGTLRGIVLRQELVFPPGEAPAGAEDGRRLSAKETGRGSGLFLAGCDGLEFLTPEDAAELTPEKLDKLLASAPAAAAPVIHETSHSSVQAPVSIQVTAAGSDPKAVGKSIYDVAEQYLLRTLKTAL